MPRRKSSNKSQVFDAESFDIHATERDIRSRIWPLARNEKLAKIRKDVRLLKGQDKVPSSKKPRSVLITLLSNVLIPGLGNAYVDSGPFSLSILILSLLVLFTTFSPVFPIVSLLSAVHLTQPAMIESGAVLVSSNPAPGYGGSYVGPSFSILLVPLLLSWIHLLFLFVNNRRVIWKP